MRRLEELLRQMCQAAKAIGNTDLENKFAEGIAFSTCHDHYGEPINSVCIKPNKKLGAPASVLN